MKKIVSVALALILVFALSASFAAKKSPTGKEYYNITVAWEPDDGSLGTAETDKNKVAKDATGDDAIVTEIINAVISIEDNVKEYGYTDYMDIVSKSVGGGSDWNLDGFATWGMSIVTKQDVNPSVTLQSKKDIYQQALDEILNS